jgi:hypothetical protein
LCPRLDSNQHTLSGATTSKWCVYQFRHPGIKGCKNSGFFLYFENIIETLDRIYSKEKFTDSLNCFTTMRTVLFSLLVLVFNNLHAQKIARPKSLAMNDAALAEVMPQLASQVLQQYKPKNTQQYWDDMSRLNLAANRYKESVAALDSIMELMKNSKSEYKEAIGIQFRTYALVKLGQSATGKEFLTVFNDTLTALYYKLPSEARTFMGLYFGQTLLQFG